MKIVLCLCAVICTAYAFPRPQEQAQADGYFQYVNVPAHKEAETGWNRGHPNHYISRYEQKKSQQFRTRVRWGDAQDTIGEHYWEQNHGPSEKKEPFPVPPAYTN